MKKPPQRKSKHSKENGLTDLFTELKSEYLQSFPEKIHDIETFWQKRDVKNLQNEFHKMKGTGSTYGVHEVSEVAGLMENLCQKKSKRLGLSLMVAIDILSKICHHHREQLPMDLNKEKSFRILRHFHDELAA